MKGKLTRLAPIYLTATLTGFAQMGIVFPEEEHAGFSFRMQEQEGVSSYSAESFGNQEEIDDIVSGDGALENEDRPAEDESTQAAEEDEEQEPDDEVSSETTDLEAVYYDLQVGREQQEREYAVYRNQLKARLAELQIEYLSELESELKQKYEIEVVKLELGYTIPVAVEEAMEQYLMVGTQIQIAEERREFYKESIKLQGEEYEEILLDENEEIMEDDYLSVFRENSAQLAYYEWRISYCGDILQNAEENNTEIVNVQRQLDLYQIQKVQYEIDMEIYVKNAMLNYRSVKLQIADMNRQIELAEQKKDNLTYLYKEGMSSKIQIMEAQTEMYRMRYERASLVCDAKLWYYILKHTIEDQGV